MRSTVVAGSFYPFSADDIKSTLNHFNANNVQMKKSYGVVAPHAGYVYSGATALLSISSIDYENVDTVVIIGPNHTGIGRNVSVSFDDWETPLGVMTNDKLFSGKLVERSSIAEHDETAHAREHSIEVELPILQYVLAQRNQKVNIVPICMLDQSMGTSEKLAKDIIKVMKELNREIVIIASSDCSHYVPADWAERHDREAIGYLLKGDTAGFNRVRIENELSICGYGPITVLSTLSSIQGFGGAELLRYTHSGVVTGNYTEVVGYAAIRFLRP